MSTLYKVKSVIYFNDYEGRERDDPKEWLLAEVPRDTFGTFDSALEYCIAEHTKSEIDFYKGACKQRLWIHQETNRNGVKTIVRFLVRPDGSFKVE